MLRLFKSDQPESFCIVEIQEIHLRLLGEAVDACRSLPRPLYSVLKDTGTCYLSQVDPDLEEMTGTDLGIRPPAH